MIVGALLCAPVDASNTCGVIYFNDVGYIGMCGYGTIGLMATLAYLGRVQPGDHRIETVVGPVTTTLHADGSVTGSGGAEFDHIELFGPVASPANNARNFVLCPGGAYDRSPCGTGTSLRVGARVKRGARCPLKR